VLAFAVKDWLHAIMSSLLRGTSSGFPMNLFVELFKSRTANRLGKLNKALIMRGPSRRNFELEHQIVISPRSDLREVRRMTRTLAHGVVKSKTPILKSRSLSGHKRRSEESAWSR